MVALGFAAVHLSICAAFSAFGTGRLARHLLCSSGREAWQPRPPACPFASGLVGLISTPRAPCRPFASGCGCIGLILAFVQQSSAEPWRGPAPPGSQSSGQRDLPGEAPTGAVGVPEGAAAGPGGCQQCRLPAEGLCREPS